MAKVVGVDESAKKRVTCKDCACIVEYIQMEVKSVCHQDYSGGSDMHYYLACPNCGSKITVKGY